MGAKWLRQSLRRWSWSHRHPRWGLVHSTVAASLNFITTDLNTEVWHEPAPHDGARDIAENSNSSLRGSGVFNGRAVVHESGLEHIVSKAIQARRDIKELRAQWPRVPYRDDDGKNHHHTFDYWIEFYDGFRVAVAVKYRSRAAKLEAQLKLVRASESEYYDDIVTMTDEHATRAEFQNALEVLLSREQHDQGQVDTLLREIWGRAKIQFFAMTVQGMEQSKRYTAIWRLIDAGVLLPTQLGRITPVTWFNVNL